MLTKALVLVEGLSDKIALEALAPRLGLDLAAAGVEILVMAGAHAIDRTLKSVAADQPGVPVFGLCDAGEEGVFRRAVERAGLGRPVTRADLEQAGFFVCVRDLEEELIRAVGPPNVEKLVEGQGELGRLRTMQKEPSWRGRPLDSQLHRYICNSYRKARYAPLLVGALDADSVPHPLAGVLTRATKA